MNEMRQTKCVMNIEIEMRLFCPECNSQTYQEVRKLDFLDLGVTYRAVGDTNFFVKFEW